MTTPRKRTRNAASNANRGNPSKRASIRSLSRNEFNIVAQHLSLRNLARLAATGRANGAMARNAVRNRVPKVALDILYPQLQAIQQYSRQVVAMAAQTPQMPLGRFQRAITELYTSYRGQFSKPLMEPDDRYLHVIFRAKAREPDGPGFVKIESTLTIHRNPRARRLEPINDNSITVVTPSVTCSVPVQWHATGFRAAKLLTSRNDPAYQPSGQIYVDAALCPGCPLARHNRQTSYLAPAHFVTRYAILGETKWCRESLTPTNALQRIEDVSSGTNSFLRPRDMLAVVATLFNDTIAHAMERALVNTMIRAQKDACDIIANKKAYEIFARYPRVEKVLRGHESAGRQPILTNSEIMSLNGPLYASLIQARLESITRMQ